MGDTNIAWSEKTWNPVTGCSRVSPGCEHCYAETLSLRMGWSKKPWTKQNAAENVKLHPERLNQPLKWRGAKLVFVNSMSDLFHPLVPFEYVDRVWDVIMRAQRHTFQVLTKRPDRMLKYFRYRMAGADVLPNLWLGTSVEDYRRWQERHAELRDTPAAVRFVSFEPWLSDGIDILGDLSWLDWAIIGGETGRDYRELNLASAESLTDQLVTFGVRVFWKQDSGPRPGKQGRLSNALWARKEYPNHTRGAFADEHRR